MNGNNLGNNNTHVRARLVKGGARECRVHTHTHTETLPVSCHFEGLYNPLFVVAKDKRPQQQQLVRSLSLLACANI